MGNKTSYLSVIDSWYGKNGGHWRTDWTTPSDPIYEVGPDGNNWFVSCAEIHIPDSTTFNYLLIKCTEYYYGSPMGIACYVSQTNYQPSQLYANSSHHGPALNFKYDCVPDSGSWTFNTSACNSPALPDQNSGYNFYFKLNYNYRPGTYYLYFITELGNGGYSGDGYAGFRISSIEANYYKEDAFSPPTHVKWIKTNGVEISSTPEDNDTVFHLKWTNASGASGTYDYQVTMINKNGSYGESWPNTSIGSMKFYRKNFQDAGYKSGDYAHVVIKTKEDINTNRGESDWTSSPDIYISYLPAFDQPTYVRWTDVNSNTITESPIADDEDFYLKWTEASGASGKNYYKVTIINKNGYRGQSWLNTGNGIMQFNNTYFKNAGYKPGDEARVVIKTVDPNEQRADSSEQSVYIKIGIENFQIQWRLVVDEKSPTTYTGKYFSVTVEVDGVVQGTWDTCPLGGIKAPKNSSYKITPNIPAEQSEFVYKGSTDSAPSATHITGDVLCTFTIHRMLYAYFYPNYEGASGYNWARKEFNTDFIFPEQPSREKDTEEIVTKFDYQMPGLDKLYPIEQKTTTFKTFNFIWWKNRINGECYKKNTIKKIKDNENYDAIWTEEPEEEYGQIIYEDMPKPVKSGYKFLGWFRDREGINPVIFPYEAMEPTTFYACWETRGNPIYIYHNGAWKRYLPKIYHDGSWHDAIGKLRFSNSWDE